MPSALRTVVPLAAALLAFAAGVRTARPLHAAPPSCTLDTVALIEAIDSAHAHIGQPFRFRAVDPVIAPDGSEIRGGELGYGVVAAAQHAERGGRGGYVALEPRFFELANGRHIQVIANRTAANATAANGSSRNVPGLFGAIPMAGWILGPYGFLHHGADVTIPPGARIPIVVGDDVTRGVCTIPPPDVIPTAPPVSRRQEAIPQPAATR